MFDKLAKKLNGIIEKNRRQMNLDAHKHFDDEVAKKTDWAPLKRGGSNFKTHTLKKISNTALQFRLSGGGIAFVAVFATIGLIQIIAAIFILISDLEFSMGLMILFMGSIFFAVSMIMLRFMGQPWTFDRSFGMIWKGKKAPKLAGPQNNSAETIYMNKVHAVQIISEYVRSNKSRYYSYEINLVLDDGKRVHIVDHGKYSQIRIDAEELAKLIHAKLWDTVNTQAPIY